METLVMPHQAVDAIDAKSVLVLAPHPDDEAIGCGGAIALPVRNGARVRVVIATDGAGPGGEGEATPSIREAESRQAARVLGYGEPVFWGVPDRSLAYGEHLVRRIGDVLEDADLVYVPGLQEMHPDHRALALATAEALRRRGGTTRLAQYEVGVPLMPNLLLDITPVRETKQRAIACFASQLQLRPYDEYAAALNRFRAYSLAPSVEAAEAFHVVAARDLDELLGGIADPAQARQQRLGLPVVPSDLPLVSVVVRTMGRPECAQALDSIALQTWPNIEVVLVDASGHAAAPAIEACGRHPVRHVRPGRPLERSAAGNAGLDAARGEWLIFLDEDDVFQPDHVARLAEAQRAAPASHAASAGVVVHGTDGLVDTYDGDVDFARMLAWNRLPIHAVLFRRSLLAHCRLDESLDLYEDWDFWLQVASRTRFVRVPGVSAIYRAGLGQSKVSDEAQAHARALTRDGIRARWLAACPPREFEWLVQSFREEIAERDRRVADLRHTDVQLREALEASRHEANVLRHAESDAIAQLERRLDARAELIELREERARIAGSWSWRVMGPFRIIGRALRRRAGR
jgi:LmbE family N-acetylglucosaminyl deacetylase/glycosyltransferase involved in cell wall biosynthesis